MNKILLSTILLVLFACQSIPEEFPWSDKSYEDLISEAGEKLLLIEFYTDW